MTNSDRNRPARRVDADTAQTVLLSAQLLALNAALGGDEAGPTGSLLAELARDLRQVRGAGSSQRRASARQAGVG